ncbi:MAG TPA: hypothetical protein VK202_01765, partial [Bacteroidia bacterium]|nr:hypothetical protein [Bacteroidia bacterium]
LNLDQKVQFLLRGKLIESRAIYNQSFIELYYVDEVYAEVFYSVYTRVVQKVEFTTEDDVLKNYFDLRELYLANRQVQPPQK